MSAPGPAGVMSLEQMLPLLRVGDQLLGLDVGTKTVGVALSDGLRMTATPLQTVRRKKFGADVAAIFKLAEDRVLGGIVIGLPLNMEGDEGPRAQASRAFARNLTRLTDLPIALQDERMSTMAAERAMLEADLSRARRAESIDAAAAGYILQSALDRLSVLAAQGAHGQGGTAKGAWNDG